MTRIPHSGIRRVPGALAGEGEIGEQPERNEFQEAQGFKATAAATSWPLAAAGTALSPGCVAQKAAGLT